MNDTKGWVYVRDGRGRYWMLHYKEVFDGPCHISAVDNEDKEAVSRWHSAVKTFADD